MDKPPFAMVPAEAFFDDRLTLRELRVLGALLTFRNAKTGCMCPSRDALSARTGFDASRISTTTALLVSRGWLKKDGAGGRGKPTHYTVTVPDEVRKAYMAANGAGKQRTETVTDSVTVNQLNGCQTSNGFHIGNGYQIGIETVTDSVTLPYSLDEQTRNREEEERGAVREKQAPDAAPAARPPKGSRMVPEWVIPVAWVTWALEQQPTWTEARVRQIAETFRDYWLGRPGQGGVKADWAATWRNWIRREAQPRGGIRSPPPGARVKPSGNAALRAQLGLTDAIDGECTHEHEDRRHPAPRLAAGYR